MATALVKAPKPDRKDVPKGANLCDYCTGKCCHYIALPIDTPENWKEFDYIRWYLSHEDISVFVEDGNWYLMVHRKCEYLLPDNRCGIYEVRPQICRDYTTDSCEYEDEYIYEKIFESEQQLFDYAEAILGPNKLHRTVGGLAIR
jgi:Fe-S-cluster containining protein